MHALFTEHFGEQPYDEGEVLALFVGGEDDGVLVGVILTLHVQRGVALERVHVLYCIDSTK